MVFYKIAALFELESVCCLRFFSLPHCWLSSLLLIPNPIIILSRLLLLLSSSLFWANGASHLSWLVIHVFFYSFSVVNLEITNCVINLLVLFLSCSLDNFSEKCEGLGMPSFGVNASDFNVPYVTIPQDTRGYCLLQLDPLRHCRLTTLLLV